MKAIIATRAFAHSIERRRVVAKWTKRIGLSKFTAGSMQVKKLEAVQWTVPKQKEDLSRFQFNYTFRRAI